MSLTLIDEFCGAGGSSSGATLVPGVELILAANHWSQAIETHAKNFPYSDHHLGDIAAADVRKFPCALLAWHSPACPPWSNARGVRRDYDATSAQLSLFGEEPLPPEATVRSRALMEEIPRYLASCLMRGTPVLAGCVENVVEVVHWAELRRWRREIEEMGYRTWLIALNSMHARGPRSEQAPQSRDRFYMAYVHRSVGRTPDFNKWLRPKAFCPSCDQVVEAIQVFKDPRVIMGRYKAQYVYRCPFTTCGRIVEPYVLPAASAIDWSDLGQVIGERERPLADKTMARIRAGFERYVIPFSVPVGGSWRSEPQPVDAAHPTVLTREADGLVVPPLMVPMEGREGKSAYPVTRAMRTQTARAEEAVVFPPFLSALRGGGSQQAVYPVDGASPTVTASGNHLALTVPDGAFYLKNYGGNARPVDMVKPMTEPWGTVTTQDHHSIVVPYYTGSGAQPVDVPIGTIPTREHWALASLSKDEVDRQFHDMVMAARFRMLNVPEVQRIMAFRPDYEITGTSKRVRVRQLGNAVTPPAAEVLMSALVECVTGEALERGH